MIAFKGGRVSGGGRRTGLGCDAGGLVAYLIRARKHEGKGHPMRSVRGHQVPTDNPWMFVEFFDTMAAENPRCTQPVYHVGASAAPGETLTTDQWSAVGEDMLRSLGLGDHQALFVVHDGDEGGTKVGQQHLHIVVNRVAEDGSVWQPSWDHPKLQAAMRRAERQHGLRSVPSSCGQAQVRHRPRLSDAAVHQAREDGEVPWVDRLRDLVASDFRQAETWTDLDGRLAAHGLAVRPARRGGGVLVVDAEGREVSLSKVMRLSGPRLTRRFGIDLRTHRLASPEPVLEVGGTSDGEADEGDIVARTIETLRTEHSVFRDRDIRRELRWHRDGVRLLETVTVDAELVSLGVDGGEGLWTTKTYREMERQLWARAARLHDDRGDGLDAGRVEELLRRDFAYFSAEQAEAVRGATSGSRLSLLQGLAGTGKTSMSEAIARVYEADGYRVVGAALSGRAADLLGQSTGIESRTLASWEARWKQGSELLDGRTVLLVDEASMVGTRQMEALLARADEQGASVILMGDPAQLRPIEPGDAFRGLLQLFPSSRLGAIRRQQEEWQRTASQAFAQGDVDVALHAYAGRGFVGRSDTRDAALRELVEQAAQVPAGDSRLVIAFRRRDVADLNTLLRAKQFSDSPPERELEIGGKSFAAGDRVLFRRNDARAVRTVGKASGPEQGVRNGSLGTVSEISGGQLVIALDSERTVAFDPSEYKDLEHGYAVTLHAAQGATVDHCLVYLDNMVDRQGIHVAGTRHRQSCRLFYDQESFADQEALVRGVSRDPDPDLVLDHRQPTPSPEAERLLASLEARRPTWTRSLLESLAPSREVVEEVLRHPDLVPLDRDLFTTRRQVLAEAELLVTVEKLRSQDSLDIILDRVLDSDSDRHSRALRRWLADESPPGPKLLVGSGPRAAQDLQAEFGMQAVSIHELAHRQGKLARGSTVVVDRAPLADRRTLHAVLARVHEAGGRAVLVGDPLRQVPAKAAQQSPSALQEIETLASGSASGEAKAEILKQLGAPQWSKLYEVMDRRATDSWTDWSIRRQALAEARRTEVAVRSVEHLHAHVDRLIPQRDQRWLEGASWRQLQRMTPGKLSTLLGLSRAVAAIASDPGFLLRLVEPRALRWARLALRVAGMSLRARTRQRERGGSSYER